MITTLRVTLCATALNGNATALNGNATTLIGNATALIRATSNVNK